MAQFLRGYQVQRGKGGWAGLGPPGRPSTRKSLPLLLLFVSLTLLVVAVGIHNPATGSGPGDPLVVLVTAADLSDGLLAYLAPLPDAQLVSPRTTIALRPVEGTLSPAATVIQVSGRSSGSHPGRTFLAEDQATIIFSPQKPFAPGETVDVTIDIQFDGRPVALTYSFQVSPPAPASTPEETSLAPAGAPALQSGAVMTTTGRYFTAPADFPIFDHFSAVGTGDGYIFLAYFDFLNFPLEGTYLLILDDNGEPIYFDRGPSRFDFKKHDNGLLTFFEGSANGFLALDQSYNVVGSYVAGNGYDTNVHDLQLLDNDHAMLTIYDARFVDMSQYVPGGDPNAIVVGCVVQELDAVGNVVFQWRSWDHISVLDSNQDLTASTIDYVHCNSLDQDLDGHILMSSRHLDEVTKINRQTSEIIWRLGGGIGNEFTFTNDTGFFLQHDARRLANGNLTVFDNHGGDYSRAVEYELDENNMEATHVWEYRNTPDTMSIAMGSNQRLPNGNSVIGWGTAVNPMVSEVMADGTKVFELGGLQFPFSTYRAFRFPWQGYPTWPPALFARQIGPMVELYFSWNGATEVSSYDIYAGPGLVPGQLIGNVPKDGFETRYDYLPAGGGLHSFRVVPRDMQGQAGPSSDIFWLIVDGQPRYFPRIIQNAP